MASETNEILIFFLGAPALTTRGFKEGDFARVVDLLDAGVKIAVKAHKSTSKSHELTFIFSHLFLLLSSLKQVYPYNLVEYVW